MAKNTRQKSISKKPSRTEEHPATAGQQACMNHQPQSANPYPKGSGNHQVWDSAWAEQKWGGIEY